MVGQTHSTIQDTTIRTTPANAIALPGPCWGLVEGVMSSTTEEERTCFWHLQVYDGPPWYLWLEQGDPASTRVPQERSMDIAEGIEEVRYVGGRDSTPWLTGLNSNGVAVRGNP